MSSARRSSSCGSERPNSSEKKPARERPMTIWVTFSMREKRRSSAGRSSPIRTLVSASKLSASLSAASTRALFSSLSWLPGLSTVTTIQGASIMSARRFAVRTIRGEIESGPTQARMRSPAAHGPSIACACMRSTRSTSMRSAARRSASSRSAVRFCSLKKLSTARAAVSCT